MPSKQETPNDPGSPAPLANQVEADLASMHWSGRNDFFQLDRIGYVQDRDHVAGFVPHRFTQMPRSRPTNMPNPPFNSSASNWSAC